MIKLSNKSSFLFCSFVAPWIIRRKLCFALIVDLGHWTHTGKVWSPIGTICAANHVTDRSSAMVSDVNVDDQTVAVAVALDLLCCQRSHLILDTRLYRFYTDKVWFHFNIHRVFDRVVVHTRKQEGCDSGSKKNKRAQATRSIVGVTFVHAGLKKQPEQDNGR